MTKNEVQARIRCSKSRLRKIRFRQQIGVQKSDSGNRWVFSNQVQARIMCSKSMLRITGFRQKIGVQ